MAVAQPDAPSARSRTAEPEALTPALLYRRHFQDVCRWVGFLVGPIPEAEDLVQEVFVVACRRLSTFRGEAKATTWLYGITRNIVRNYRRKAKVRKFFTAEDTQDPDDLPSRTPTPLDDAERLERERTVYEVLDGMKEKYRTVLILFELEGLDGKEIGARLGIKEATVFVQLHRARKQFLDGLEKMERAR